MTVKTHVSNTDFQYRYFLAGEKHTPDGRYCALYAEMIRLEDVIAENEIELNRRNDLLQNYDHSPSCSDAVASVRATQRTFLKNLEAAKRELSGVKQLMDDIRPHCKYAHLDILDQQEACQREEWRLEFIARAEDHLLTTGFIPPEQLRAMRLHPDYRTGIAPVIATLAVQTKRHEVMRMISATLALEDRHFTGIAVEQKKNVFQINHNPTFDK